MVISACVHVRHVNVRDYDVGRSEARLFSVLLKAGGGSGMVFTTRQ